jgi:hypothetical protein
MFGKHVWTEDVWTEDVWTEDVWTKPENGQIKDGKS